MLDTMLAPRLWRMLLIPAMAFAALAYLTEDRALILVFNIVQVAAAIAVVVTFTPAVWAILVGREPMNRTSWLAYGIWLGWGSVAYRGVETLVWRFLGQPLWLVNSDLTSAYLFMGIIGAASHIVKPGGLGEELPRREMIRVGLIIGAAALVGMSIVSAPEIYAAWTGKRLSEISPQWERAIAGPPPGAPAAREKDIDVFREVAPTTDEALTERLSTGVSSNTRARVEQYRQAHGLRSGAAAVRDLLTRGLADDDRDALGQYEPDRK